MTRRNTLALREFKAASDRASRVMIWLTVTLVVLTIALVVETAVVTWLTSRL